MSICKFILVSDSVLIWIASVVIILMLILSIHSIDLEDKAGFRYGLFVDINDDFGLKGGYSDETNDEKGGDVSDSDSSDNNSDVWLTWW